MSADVIETLQALGNGFGVALQPVNLLWGFVGVHARHGGRRAAGHRARADGRDAPAVDRQARSDRRADHVRRHLLRRDVRRIDHHRSC